VGPGDACQVERKERLRVSRAEESIMTKKHPPPDEQPVKLPDDLDENPGIGQSKGLFARAGSKDADLIEGASTVEGDVENDATLGQGADERRLGRKNK
jgi:hypothetical protein